MLLRLLLLNLLPPCEDPRESLNSSKYGVYMSSKYGEKRTACVQYVFSIYARTCARPRAARPAGLPAPGPRSVRRPAWPPAGPAAVCLRGSRGHGSATPGPPSLGASPRDQSAVTVGIYPHTRLDALLIAVRVPPRVRVARPVRARTGASGHQRHRQSPLVLGRVRSSPASSSHAGGPRRTTAARH